MNRQADNNESLLLLGVNYRKLITFQKTEAVYDITWNNRWAFWGNQIVALKRWINHQSLVIF